jgi:RND family efflux transporter MFP subunit
MNSLEIEVDVNESYISRVRPGQIVEAVLDAYPGWRIPARVITTIPAADRQKATVLVRIGFDELDPRILPDMGIKVAFRARQEPDAEAAAVTRRVRIPRDALRDDRGGDVVYVVVDDRVERRAVNVGGSTNGDVLVIAGLRAGENVIVEGPADLAAGDRVKEDR